MLSLNINNDVYLSVIIAAYNEESIIANNITQIIAELESRSGVNWEIICIDDGSIDKTGRLLDDLASSEERLHVFHHRRNYGQGRALRTGFSKAQGKVIVSLDADLSYSPKYIWRLVDTLQAESVEIALASAYMRGGKVLNVPFVRKILSYAANRYLSFMLPFRISTSTCVVRAYRREVLNTLILTSDGMEILVEILVKAHIAGFRISEIPADLIWQPSPSFSIAPRRISKMRKVHSLQNYLFMGLISNPAILFLILSFIPLSVGVYMVLILFIRVAQSILHNLSIGFVSAISLGFQTIFKQYTYSVVFSGAFLFIGIQIFAYSFIILQNKYYFEETLKYTMRKNNETH